MKQFFCSMRQMLKKSIRAPEEPEFIIFKNTGIQKIEYTHNGETFNILVHPEAQEILTELSKELSPSNVRTISANIFFEILEMHLF